MTTVRSPDACADSLHRNPGNTAATPALPLTTLAIESACADATACLAMSARLTLAPVVGSESTTSSTPQTCRGATRYPSSPCVKRVVNAVSLDGERRTVPHGLRSDDDRKATWDLFSGGQL